MRDACPFCDYEGPSRVLSEWEVLDGAPFRSMGPTPGSYFVIEPLDPVTKGHRLVIPRKHVSDFRDSEYTLRDAMAVAAICASEIEATGCNLIVSAGREASQTVMHLHVHVVPRREGDGLRLPWPTEEDDVKISQWTCPKDGCDYVHETRARLGATPTPRCPEHEVPMLLAGWR